MPPTTHDEFESAVIKVEFAAIVDGEQVFSEWARPPIAHEGCDLANVLDAIPVDCGAVVVPLGFASWAEAYVPRLLVQHVLVEDGKEEFSRCHSCADDPACEWPVPQDDASREVGRVCSGFEDSS